MMKIISINAGSSSLKFKLFEMKDESVLASGLFERIGIEGSCYTIKYDGNKVSEQAEMPTHAEAVSILLNKLIDLDIIKSLDEIEGIGHRVVTGGEKYKQSVLIDNKVIKDVEDCIELAPLHNPANIIGINAFRKALPNVKMAAVFDTAFHQTMDPVSYLYPVPYAWYEDHKVRKYGAHGTSHMYIAEAIAKELKKDNLKVISCHLGNGGSISAIKDGKCVDTSMGFTPIAGIMMGTRSGDVDPSIIPYIMVKETKNASEVLEDLNKRSGFLGLSGISSDSRDIEKGISEGNERCILAQEKYVRTIVNYIAQYYVLLGGCDALVFTAGIGENSSETRKRVVEKLACLGFKMDLKANDVRGELRKLSTDDSKSLIYLIPTDEELMIARETVTLVKQNA
ncbi:MAG: acetate kinase [Bacilli bacterium]|nr:acetate kinase [Bacilli bacterium]